MFGESEEMLLRRKKLGRICTVDQKGYPHCVRVEFVNQEGRVLIGSRSPRIWHEHLSANPKIAFEIDMWERQENGVFDYRGLMLKGEAQTVRGSTLRAKAMKLLKEKHPGAPFGKNPIVIGIIPRKRYRWGPWDKVA